ncbi:Defb22 [Phodopus roborovskii]|uniref:Defb22 protein n=1 Tax=Phodopus roborovskii TaxID=109678 RepID=A0AAU9YP16_PHORO|nr:Defb22 [Phodopus roborovskii]
MKSPLPTVVIIILLAHLVTGSWYVKKCANKLGNCRKVCRKGELKTNPATGFCPKEKHCCVLSLKVPGCGGTTIASGGTAGTGAGTGAPNGTPGAATPKATTAAP